MKTAVIILVILIYLILGCFLMLRVNDFIESNRKEPSEKRDRKDPSCVILVGEQTDEAIMDSLHDFKDRHNETRILIYDNSSEPSQNDLNENYDM